VNRLDFVILELRMAVELPASWVIFTTGPH
jgi:hypothetical protein